MKSKMCIEAKKNSSFNIKLNIEPIKQLKCREIYQMLLKFNNDLIEERLSLLRAACEEQMNKDFKL